VIGRSSFFVVLVIWVMVEAVALCVRDNLSDSRDLSLFRCISVGCLFFCLRNTYKKDVNYYVIIINKIKIMLK
jgi:hypothetical protein